MKIDILIIGHIVKEMIKFPDRLLGPVLGSPVAYSSVVAGKLNANVAVVTRLGNDINPDLLYPIFKMVKDTKGIIIEGSKTTISHLIYKDNGAKQMIYPQRAPEIRYSDIPKKYFNCDLIYICPMDYDVSLETILKLRKLDVLLAADIGGYGGAHSIKHPPKSAKKNPKILKRYVKNFDIIKASDEDCRLLLGERSEKEISNLFLSWGVKYILITKGDKGVYAADIYNKYEIPAFKGEVIDSTGAGDSFTMGFLIKFLESNDIKLSAYYGSAVANYVIRRTGGVSIERMPKRKDVQKILTENNIYL